LAAPRNTDLDHWVANVLTPFVTGQLASHPRFKGESLRFVVLENGNPQAMSNSLALRIRDQLRDAAADLAGVRIAWQPDNPHYLRNTGPGGVDCTKVEVHYLIGIEVDMVESGRIAVELRALDVEDRTAVAGFSKSWRGPISSRQYREFRRIETDLTFRGEREVPYEDSQTDLLAAHLAHDLGCNLLRQMDAEYVIAESGAGGQPDPVAGMVELVSNNLSQYSTLQFTVEPDNANAVIEGKAHRIDADLYQYWVTVHATDPESDLQAMSASAYIRLPEQFSIAARYHGQAPELSRNAAFLTSLGIVELQNSAECATTTISSRLPGYSRPYGADNVHCFALQVQASGDAVVFFLNHQLNNGLVRLAAPSCPQRTSARIARTGQKLQFALPPDSLPSSAWSAAVDWQLQPDLDTYYAIAATDTKAARALSQHIERLPKRCSGSVRPGLEGFALRRWMEELIKLVSHWEPTIDWRTIRVKNVF
jgi:hypothetical protein